jgi:hypothetical protein
MNSLLITQGFGVRNLIAVQGYNIAVLAPLIKESYGQGAPIFAVAGSPRYVFYAENTELAPAILSPPTADNTGT